MLGPLAPLARQLRADCVGVVGSVECGTKRAKFTHEVGEFCLQARAPSTFSELLGVPLAVTLVAFEFLQATGEELSVTLSGFAPFLLLALLLGGAELADTAQAVLVRCLPVELREGLLLFAPRAGLGLVGHVVLLVTWQFLAGDVK